MFRPKRSLHGRRILLTGASSGIGRALALELARYNTQLLLTARRETQLRELQADVAALGSVAHIVAGDITDVALRQQLIETSRIELRGLDVLVNNAGIGGLGTFASANETRLRQIMEVNFFAPAELLRATLPLLRASDDAVIVNVGSVLGHCAVPKKSEYCASKFALHGLTDALRMELANEDIDVLLASPSTTRSEFFEHAMRSDGNVATNSSAMSCDVVAKRIVHAILSRRREIILSIGGKLLVFADRIAPWLTSRVLKRFG